VIHQKRIRQAGAVERGVNLYGYNGPASTLGHLYDIQRHVDGEDFLIGRRFDRGDPANFPSHIFDYRVKSEAHSNAS